ncbi:hypothetical protein P9139_11180 [Curtobacterium flaccumfaciens]|nr:hypothetical protein P9139_11180 [Curtobacterium flaccumfaciens]
MRESPVFAAGEIALGRFTVLTGMHGAGKSYFLAVLREALPGWQSGWSLPPVSRWDRTDFSGVYSLAVRPASSGGTSVAAIEFPLERIEYAPQYPRNCERSPSRRSAPMSSSVR